MQEMYRLETDSFVYSVLIGFAFMCVIYFVDYTVIAKYAKIIGLLIIMMGVLLLAASLAVILTECDIVSDSEYSGFLPPR